MTSALTRRLYVIAWLVLGAIALVYLFSLYSSMQGPQTASGPTSPFARSPLVENETGAPQNTGATDPTLTQALARMNGEIENLKSSLESARQENAALKAHIRTLEATYGPSTAALPPEPEKPAQTVAEASTQVRSEPERNIDVRILPMPRDGFEDTFQEAPLPIANLEEPKRTQFAVELAWGLKSNAVEPRWAALAKRHGKLLAALQPRRVADDGGTPGEDAIYKLVAGPFNNAADAAQLCARLSAKGTKCEGTVFTGAPIGDVAAR